MSIAALAAEIATLQAVADPIGEALSVATPGSPGYEAMEIEYETRSGRILDAVRALADLAPQNSREALALAVIAFDQAFDAENGACDTTGTLFAAVRGLVAYLAMQARVAPTDLGMFRHRLAEAGLGGAAGCDAPTRHELSPEFGRLISEHGRASARHDELDRSSDGEPAQCSELETTAARMADLERALLTAVPATPADVAALAIVVRLYQGATKEADQDAAERGVATLINHLLHAAGASAADLGLRHLWREEFHRTPARPVRPVLGKRLAELRTVHREGLLAISSDGHVTFYGEDADTVAKAVGLMRFSRVDGAGGRMTACDIPEQSIGSLLPRLVELGHSVMLCPLESPAQ